MAREQAPLAKALRSSRVLSGDIERLGRRVLITVAGGALIIGVITWAAGFATAAKWIWGIGTALVASGLLLSIVRDVLAGRVGVDAIAFISMAGAVLLGETLAGVVVAVMYAGGNVLEDFAVGRAERELKSLVDRAPRVAHRLSTGNVEDVPVERITIGDAILVRAGETVPVDGVITGAVAVLDEAALTGEPIPVNRRIGEGARSGAINAGETFQMRASATAGESTYAGSCTSLRQRRPPRRRSFACQIATRCCYCRSRSSSLAQYGSYRVIRYGTCCLGRGDACPLILAAQGGGPLEALARTCTVMFDKTGTLTVGGARLIAIEAAPGEKPEEVLRLLRTRQH